MVRARVELEAVQQLKGSIEATTGVIADNLGKPLRT